VQLADEAIGGGGAADDGGAKKACDVIGRNAEQEVMDSPACCSPRPPSAVLSVPRFSAALLPSSALHVDPSPPGNLLPPRPSCGGPAAAFLILLVAGGG
jgi:hypothetical protein